MTTTGLTTKRAEQLMAILDRASNMLGGLSPAVRARVFAVAAHPTQETWDDAQSIVIDAESHMTLERAVSGYTTWTEGVPTSQQIVLGPRDRSNLRMTPEQIATRERACATPTAEQITTLEQACPFDSTPLTNRELALVAWASALTGDTSTRDMQAIEDAAFIIGGQGVREMIDRVRH